MSEILAVVSKVSYVALIVFSVVFGISLAVRVLVVKTIKSIVKESDKNFDKIGDNDKKIASREIIENSKKEYLLYLSEVKKNQKQKGKTSYENAPLTKDGKHVFLDLIKNCANVYTEGESFLSFSLNETFEILRILVGRIKSILCATNLFFLRYLKLSLLMELMSLYRYTENFKQRRDVKIALAIINFCMAVSTIFSPVGASKKLINSIVGGETSLLISHAIIEVVGKEVCYIYYEKSFKNHELQKTKEIA